MALDGFTVAGQSTGAPATPGAATALKGFSVGSQTATPMPTASAPPAPTALKGFTGIAGSAPGSQAPDLSGKSLNISQPMTMPPMPAPVDTSKMFSSFATPKGLINFPQTKTTSVPKDTVFSTGISKIANAPITNEQLATVPQSLTDLVGGMWDSFAHPKADETSAIDANLPGGTQLIGTSGNLFKDIPQDLAIPAKAMGRFFQPIIQGAGQNIADAILANSAKARGTFNVSADDIKYLPSAQESILQGVGNFMLLAFAVATPSLGSKLGIAGASEDTMTQILRASAGKTVKESFAPLAKIVGKAAVSSAIHGGEAGIYFGTASALSQGQTDPGAIAQTVFKSAMGMGILGAMIGVGGVGKDAATTAVLKDVKTKFGIPQKIFVNGDLIREYVNTGKMSNAEATELFKQLGALNKKGALGALSEQAKEQGTSVTKLTKTGASFSITPEEVISITDKPYWAKVKGAFGLTPSSGRIIPGTAELSERLGLPAAKVDALKTDIADNLERNHPESVIAEEISKEFGVPLDKAMQTVHEISEESGHNDAVVDEAKDIIAKHGPDVAQQAHRENIPQKAAPTYENGGMIRKEDVKPGDNVIIKSIYRGEGPGNTVGGSYFSADKNFAQAFAGKGGKVIEIKLPPEKDIYDLTKSNESNVSYQSLYDKGYKVVKDYGARGEVEYVVNPKYLDELDPISHALETIKTSGGDWDKAIQSGDMPKESIYTGEVGGPFTKEAVDHVVSDVVQKMNTVQKGLGDGFKPTLNNPTRENILDQATKYLEARAAGKNSPDIVGVVQSVGDNNPIHAAEGGAVLAGTKYISVQNANGETQQISADTPGLQIYNADYKNSLQAHTESDRIIREARVPRTPAEIKYAHDKVANPILAARPDEQVKSDAVAHVEENRQALIDAYIREHGNFVGADEAKELMPGYSSDRSTSDLVQKGASLLSDAVYNHIIEKGPKNGKNEALITGGGTGSGKSTALRDSGINTKDFGVIFDSNSANIPATVARIEKALSQGFAVNFVYVHAPVDKAYDRVLDRANEMTKSKGSGRPVSAQGHIDMHHGAPDVVAHLLEKYKDNPHVKISIIDNSAVHAKAVEKPVDFIKKVIDTKKHEGQLHADLNRQREEAAHESRINERTNSAFERAEGLRPRKVSPEDSRGNDKELEQKEAGSDKLKEGERGFVSPGQAAKDIADVAIKVKDTLEQIQKARELTGDVRMSIYQHENARKAMRVRLTNLVQEVGNLLDAEGWETLYHYDEDKDRELSPSEKEIYDEFVLPLKRSLTDVISKYRAAGGSITPDLFFMNEGEYTPRFAKDKQSALDKLLDKAKDKVRSISNGGLLSKSMGTVDKSRKFYAATDENGNRIVVYVPTDKSQNVLAFRDGKITDLGPVKGMRSPKVPEFFDANTMRKLQDLAASIGVTHKRVPLGADPELARKNAGVSLTGRGIVKTRISPSWVLAHEIGHQIDDKYGMQKFMKDERYDPERKTQVIAEMRDLADKRYEGMDVPDSYKKYVRKGEEKMAVMFEAYILNREMFKTVAPHLYDDFRDFLDQHDELRPFLDIQPQLTLGKTVHGGEQSGKIGSTFVDSNKKEYEIGQATTAEIEKHTAVQYHKNVLANYVVAFDRANNALGAMKLLERLKNEQAFGEIIKKDSPETAFPEGWKSVGDKLPQFRGYHMEPRTAEALEDLAGRQQGSVHVPVFDEVNNFLTTAIVLNPIMHVPNVISGRSLAAAVGDVSAGSLKNFGRAFEEVRNRGPLYLKYLEHGAPFMALKDTAKSFADAIFTQYTSEVENEPSTWQALSDSLGYANPKALSEGFMHINETITWGSNDIFFMHALMDYNDAHGGSMEDAIKEVSKRMADYRIPERILLPGTAGRGLSKLMQSRVMLFGRFHYTGVIRPWLELAREGATGTAAEKVTALRGFAYLLIMGLAVWPYINKMWQGITDSPTTYESMPGPLRPIEVGQRLVEDGIPGIPRALQAVFTPSPALKSTIELGFNVDLFNHNPIYGPLPAEGFTAYGTSLVSPLASASRMTPKDFALSLFGIWTPKNVPAKSSLQQMKYDELPALQSQVKKDILAGKTEKANDEMAEYNTRAVAAWNQYQLESNGTDFLKTDAQKQAFLKTWGIKAPGEKALGNANALYGDGSLTSKSSLLSTVVMYAKAIDVNPSEAFHLMFTGQKIVNVVKNHMFDENAAIIIERMPLSASEDVKKERGAQPGMVLDHIIPLEAGGSNDENNLNLIPAANNEGEQHQFENLLGSAVKQGKISQAKVREYSIRYKIGQGETLPAEMMKEFTDKYGGKPITLQEVYEAIQAANTPQAMQAIQKEQTMAVIDKAMGGGTVGAEEQFVGKLAKGSAPIVENIIEKAKASPVIFERIANILKTNPEQHIWEGNHDDFFARLGLGKILPEEMIKIMNKVMEHDPNAKIN